MRKKQTLFEGRSLLLSFCRGREGIVISFVVSLCLIATLTIWKRLSFLQSFPDLSTVVFDRFGEKADVFLSADEKWRFPTSLSRIGSSFKDASICLEDQRFFLHPGIDPFSLARAFYQNISQHRVVSGASTITMQLVRLLSPKPRRLTSKIVEALDAFYMELLFSKEEILRWYFTLTPYGRNIEGVEAAAHVYWRKSVRDLDFSEIATLLLLPQNPGRVFITQKELWKINRDRNLQRFFECGLLTHEDLATELSKEVRSLDKIQVRKVRHHARSLRARFPDQYEIHTTLQESLMNELERKLHLRKPHFKNMMIDDAAILVVENHSGEVWAAIGNFPGDHETGDINALEMRRSPGSTLKPLIYALALEEGLILPETLLRDIPIDYSGYAPENYDERFRGLVSAREALAQSLNVPFVQLLREVGMERFLVELEKIDIKIGRQRQKLGLSAAIGAISLTPWDLARIYLSFARGGVFPEITDIKTSGLPSIHGERPTWRDAGAVYLTSEDLKIQKRREALSSRYVLQAKNTVSWKTGTSQGRRDAWAIGYDTHFTVLVWTGNLNMRPSPFLVGAQTAGPLLFEIFDLLGQKYDSAKYLQAAGDVKLQEYEVCRYSGLSKHAACPTKKVMGLERGGVRKSCEFHEFVEIEEKSGLQVFPGCRDGLQTLQKSVQRLPYEIKRWMISQGMTREYNRIHPQCTQRVQKTKKDFLISLPQNGAVYYIGSAENPARLRLPLRFHSPVAEVQCFLNGHQLNLPHLAFATLEVGEGEHHLYCTDELSRSTLNSFRVQKF